MQPFPEGESHFSIIVPNIEDPKTLDLVQLYAPNGQVGIGANEEFPPFVANVKSQAPEVADQPNAKRHGVGKGVSEFRFVDGIGRVETITLSNSLQLEDITVP